MPVIKIQGKEEELKGIYYEFDPSESPLGEGGMGRVYMGRRVDKRSGRSENVAIKFMYSDLPEHAILRARREASIQIKNSNLVEMYGFIETETTTEYGSVERRYHVVSELLDGVMLDDLLNGKITNKSGKTVPLAEKLYNDFKSNPNRFAIYIIKNVLSGLMALHDAGYIHRDIDPTNIMITSDGHVKLIDFGIAKQINSLTTHDKGLTVSGVFIGKPEYAAPELVLGEVKVQGKTTDIYAVGVLLYQCLIGETPFQGARHEVLQKQLHEKLPLNKIKYPSLRKIIAKATEKSQSKRYSSAAEFRVAIENCPLVEKPQNGNKAKLVYGLASALMLGVASYGVINLIKTTPEPEPVPTVNVVIDSYAEACKELHSQESASSGLEMLKRLADKGDAKATFLLSRLYFMGNTSRDMPHDSIVLMRAATGLSVDNSEAHALLEKAISQDATNYQALYELGKDYHGGNQRADGYVRDIEKAKQFYQEALDYAKQSDSQEYVMMIENDLNALNNN